MDILIHIIINCLIGFILFIFGFALLKYKAVDLIAGYQPGKYDDDKLSEIYGSHLMVAGFVLTLYSMLFYFLPEHIIMHYLIMYSFLMIAIIRMVYQGEKYARKF